MSNDGDTRTQERRGVERAESAINQTPGSASPFLKELDSITGPNSPAGSGDRAIAQLDKDGFTGRAEALEARKILDETKGSLWRHLPFTDNQITRDDIDKYSARPNLSDGERALSQRLLKDFNKISSDGQSITPADITKFEAREKQHADLKNLYAKDPATGKSLFDSIKTNNGGVSGEKLDQRLADPNLSARDRASLEAVNDLRAKTMIAGSPYGDVSSGALQRANDASGLTPQERQGSIKRPEPLSAEAQATQRALGDLTARPNGGVSLLDRVGDGKGGINLRKVDELARYPERNNLTERNVETLKFLQSHAPTFTDSDGMVHRMDYGKADLQKLAAGSAQSWDKITARPERTKVDDVTAGRQRDFAHLFERQNGRPSLYDRLKSEDGSVSHSRIEEELRRPSLSAADRHSLDYVKGLSRDGILYGRRDLTAQDLIDKAHQHSVSDRDLKRGGLDPAKVAERAGERPGERTIPRMDDRSGERTIPRQDDRTGERTGARQGDRPTDRNRPQPERTADGDLSPAVQSALKVRAGEGYWHAAERLISEAHKGQRYEASQKEMRELVNQLRQANGNRKSLNQHEELRIDHSIKSNPALVGLFR